jgi:hypothetical protein
VDGGGGEFFAHVVVLGRGEVGERGVDRDVADVGGGALGCVNVRS